MTTFLVMGLGLQGTAAAHDLIVNGLGKRPDGRILLLDNDSSRLEVARERLVQLTGCTALETIVADAPVDPKDGATGPVREALGAADAAMNCLPYRFSEALTTMALDAGCHIADLGGNTAIVRRQLALAAEHWAGKDTAVLPDCGLMPGMGNLFVAHAVRTLGSCEEVRVRCGGLPVEPSGPLDYALLFNVYGLINEYFGRAQVLRGGALDEVETFTELEPVGIDFPGYGLPARECEAFITSGGLSTTPWTFAGEVGELDYKTVRYRGHFEKFKLLVELGLLGEEELGLLRGGAAVPRDVLATLLERVLAQDEVEDLAFLRCSARRGDQRLVLEMFDRRSAETGFTAMERTTAYSATACLLGVLEGRTEIGRGPIEVAVDTDWYLEELGKRGISVKVDRTG